MTFDQEPPDEADYRLAQESDESDAAEAAFVQGYARAGVPLSSEERDVAAQAWVQAWRAGAAFEREWATAHEPNVQESEHGPDWSDWGIDHPEEGPSCRCGFNGTPEECQATRSNERGQDA